MAWSGYILDLVAVAGSELGWAEVSQVACRRVPLYQPMYSVTARRAATALPSASVTSPVRRLGSKQMVFDKKLLQTIVTRADANEAIFKKILDDFDNPTSSYASLER